MATVCADTCALPSGGAAQLVHPFFTSRYPQFTTQHSLHSYWLSFSAHLRVGRSFQLPICAAPTATGSRSSPGAGHTPLQSAHSPSHHDLVSKGGKHMAIF